MSLAERYDLIDRTGYVPAVFAITAFALGVQIALVTEALAAANYPPAGKATLAWGSGLLLALSAVLHVPWRRVIDRGRQAVPRSAIPRRSVHLEPHDPMQEAPPQPQAHFPDGHDATSAADLRVRVHSPLSAGPVVAPGEELPLTIEAEPEELARELEVAIALRGPDGSRTVHERVDGTQLEQTATFDEAGPFTVRVDVDHPRAEPATKTLRGRVAPYEEEVGRLFEHLKDEATDDGLAVSPGSTPREVCRELRTRTDADASQLADLAVELEVALYGDEDVDRGTYETIHAAIAATGLLEEAPAQEVPR